MSGCVGNPRKKRDKVVVDSCVYRDTGEGPTLLSVPLLSHYINL